MGFVAFVVEEKGQETGAAALRVGTRPVPTNTRGQSTTL